MKIEIILKSLDPFFRENLFYVFPQFEEWSLHCISAHLPTKFERIWSNGLKHATKILCYLVRKQSTGSDTTLVKYSLQ